jgi:hypothetical protein
MLLKKSELLLNRNMSNATEQTQTFLIDAKSLKSYKRFSKTKSALRLKNLLQALPIHSLAQSR